MPAVSQAVADALVAVIAGLTLTPAAAGVRKRKRPQLFDGEPLPVVLVCQHDRESYEWMGRTVGFHAVYPVTVALAFRSGGRATENPALRQWWDAILPAVAGDGAEARLKAAGLTGIDRVDPDGRVMFDGSALNAAGVDWSAKAFRVAVLQAG